MRERRKRRNKRKHSPTSRTTCANSCRTSRNFSKRKYQASSSRYQTSISMQETKARSDLEERTFMFAQNVRAFVRKLPKGIINGQDGVQLIRSSGSVGANYIEAQEA